MPYSQQFKFVFLATCPFCPRWLACRAINSWMAALYAKCGMSSMSPAPHSDHNFTGQCNDAFFPLAKKVGWFVACRGSNSTREPGAEHRSMLAQGRVTYLIDKVRSFQGHSITLESGTVLPADILVNARKRPLHALACRLCMRLPLKHIGQRCSTASHPCGWHVPACRGLRGHLAAGLPEGAGPWCVRVVMSHLARSRFSVLCTVQGKCWTWEVPA